MLDLNQSPYYDDYNKDGAGVNPFLKIMFRPGFPVQARELTQIQSILQGQVSRFGSYMFTNGSKVTGGDLSLNKALYLKLDADSMAVNSLDWSYFQDKELESTGGVKAKVTEITNYTSTSTDEGTTIFIQYITAGTFAQGETLGIVGTAFTVDVADVADFTGEALIASINDGVFYVNEYFVQTEGQSLVVDRSWTASAKIGLTISDYFVTESEDSTLLDPAYGSYNFNAPGAHRYVIALELTQREYSTINETDANFVELLRVSNGEIASEVTNPKFSEFEEELARRTYDESGSYTVSPFQISFEEHETDDDKLALILDAGKAYVNGYEFETISKTTLEMDRARDTETYSNNDSFVNYGLYYECTGITTAVFSIGSFESVSLRNVSNVEIGTAKVKATVPTGSSYIVYLTDIQVTDSNDVRTIVGSSGAVATIDISGGTVDLLKGTTSQLVFPFYPENPKVGTITDVNYRTQRKYTGVLSTNQITITTASPLERFVGSGTFAGSDSIIETNYIFVVDGVIAVPTSVEIPAVGNTEVGRLIATFASGTTIQAIAAIEVNASTPKVKVRKSASKVVTVGSAWVELDYVDVIPSSVQFNAGAITSFQVDSGQRDEYYGLGRVRRTDGASASVTVTYDYYEHSGVGYFTVDSYTNEDYSNIPTYASSNTTYDLKNCFDFRPSIEGTITAQIPVNGSSVQFDYEYYVARYDRVVLTKARELSIVRGTPALTPKVPQEPVDSMTLYIVRVSPYTLNARDVGVKFVENRRYTMRDIGKLEKRIENLEYYTALSLLESKTATLTVDNKFRNGFLVDAFSTTDIVDMAHLEYDAFIDTEGQICYPPFIPKEHEATITTLPSGVIQTNDGCLIRDYSEVSIVEQKVITGFINVNPFNVFNWVGKMKLSPSTDNWVEEYRLPDVINTITTDTVPAGFKPSTTTTSTLQYSVWLNGAHDGTATTQTARNKLMQDFVNRTGIPSIGSTDRQWYQEQVAANVYKQTTTSSYVQETTKTVSATDTTISSSVIPYIRNKEVTVQVTGLVPGTRYYFNFDGVDVNAYVKPSAGNYGDAVTANASGVVNAIFNIPGSTFKTGDRILRISDNLLHNAAAETSYALATYTAEGFLVVKQRTVILNKIREVVTDTSSRTVVQFSWTDPLAQTFLVDSNSYPEGLFISSIDLYFVSKDDSVPVTVELRPTVNGYPSSTEVYAFATKSVAAADVVVNDINSTSIKGYADTHFTATKFSFDTPVYLEPGEHSFVVLANSNKYRIAYATIGKEIYNSTTVMSENPYNGVMFMSQNASTWTADQYSDICFKLNRCEFVAGESADIVWNVSHVSDEVYDSLNFAVGITNFDATDYTFAATTKAEATDLLETLAIEVNTNNVQTTRKIVEADADIEVVGNITSTNLLSPVLDLERTYMVLVENVINNDSTDEDVPYAGAAVARYLHQKVTLADDYVATDIRVWIDAYIPSAAQIKVYVKYQNTTNDSSTFDDLGWEEMAAITSTGFEKEYRLSVATGFTVYQTKVVMLSSDPTKSPSFTNFRVVTFQE